MIELAGPDPDRAADTAFLLTISRRPSPAEREKFKSMTAGKPLAESLTRLGVVLFNLNEFIYLE